MATLRLLPRDIRLVAAAAALGLALLAVAAGVRFGAAALLVPTIAFAATWLLARPGLAVSIFLAAVVLGEPTGDGLITQSKLLVAKGPGGATPLTGFLLLATAAVLLDLLRRRKEPVLPRALGLPLLLIALAAVGGVIVGTGNGAGYKDTVFQSKALPFLLLTPILVANVIHTREQAKRLITWAAAAGILKALLGLGAVFAGIGEEVEGAVITYYEPFANWFSVLLMLGALAVVITGVKPTPRLLLLAGVLCTASLVFSQRRSFWLGAVFALILLVMIGASRFGRRLVVPSLALLLATLWLLVGSGSRLEGPIAERAESLRPSKVEANAQDRYRLDERANVVAEIKEHPLTGLGLAVDWSAAARPLPVEHENGREYVHGAVLWFWLKLGLLGVVGLLAYYGAAVRLGWHVWRRVDDPLLRAIGLAVVAGIAGLFLVETTGAFTGVEERMSATFGAVLGWLAAILAAPASAAAPDDPA